MKSPKARYVLYFIRGFWFHNVKPPILESLPLLCLYLFFLYSPVFFYFILYLICYMMFKVWMKMSVISVIICKSPSYECLSVLLFKALLLCVHTRYNLFAHSSCTSPFILIFIKSTVDCIAHFSSLHILLLILFYFIFYLFFILFLPIFIYTLLCYVSFCTVHWADPSWPTFHYWLYPVWLCMWQINKNLEPWTLNHWIKNKKIFVITSQITLLLEGNFILQFFNR